MGNINDQINDYNLSTKWKNFLAFSWEPNKVTHETSSKIVQSTIKSIIILIQKPQTHMKKNTQ